VTPRAVLFDALGTLVELAPPAPRLQAELEARFGVRPTEEEAQAAMAAEIRFYRRHLDEGRDRDSLAALRAQCAAALRSALPPAAQARLPPPAELVDALLASLHFAPFSDVVPALEAYRARGLRLLVVSNWDVSLHEVLANVGLSPLLDGILTAAEAGVPKPAPGIFRQALRLAGVTPAEAIHVGDSVEEDVAGARAAGIEPVLLDREIPRPPGPGRHSAARRSMSARSGVRTVTSLEEALF
jgi:putative hydrolase of the HAD superfamily